MQIKSAFVLTGPAAIGKTYLTYLFSDRRVHILPERMAVREMLANSGPIENLIVEIPGGDSPDPVVKELVEAGFHVTMVNLAPPRDAAHKAALRCKAPPTCPRCNDCGLIWSTTDGCAVECSGMPGSKGCYEGLKQAVRHGRAPSKEEVQEWPQIKDFVAQVERDGARTRQLMDEINGAGLAAVHAKLDAVLKMMSPGACISKFMETMALKGLCPTCGSEGVPMHYLVSIDGDVSPLLQGPFMSEMERDVVAARIANCEFHHGYDGGVFSLDITHGIPSFDPCNNLHDAPEDNDEPCSDCALLKQTDRPVWICPECTHVVLHGEMCKCGHLEV